jgi:hypothetical protein
MSSRRALLFFCAAFFASAGQAGAQWALDTEANLFYTDDVSLFSASRRLALMEDPTQPAVDVTGQGSDMVVEPQAELKRTFSSSFGRTELSVKAQGFVFATNPIYNHGTFRFEIEQDLARSLMLRVNYYYAPDLFLARNTQRSTGVKADERVSTHIYSAHLEGRPTEDLTLRLLTRYGSRDYNAAFSNRDTTLWTVGPHVEWAAARWLDVTAGYHYERGLADGRNQPQSKDDVSYINHYLALGLMIKPMEDHAIFLGADYEHNIFTSTIVGDERRGEKEDIYQWELEYRRTLGPRAVFTAGFQRSVRVSNIPARSVPDNNTWLGLEYKF